MTHSHDTPTPAPQMPVSVQVLSTLLFAAFAIPVTIVALNVFWPAGVALALLLGWRGGFAPSLAQTPQVPDIARMMPHARDTEAAKPSGNASFDAYRHDTLARLEHEQEKFEGFLARLRDAKDKTEFDQFMDDRATREEMPA